MAKIHESVYIADGVVIKGGNKITIGEDSSLWYNTVVRAEYDTITIGKRTNIQDGSMVHVDYNYPVVIGDDCTIGHNAIIHGCTIGNNCIIGMGAIIMDGAVVGDNCIIGAGSLISEHKEIPAGSIAFGNPAKVRKGMTAENIASNKDSAIHYVEVAKAHRNGEYD